MKLASGFRGAHLRLVRASKQQMVRAMASHRRDRDKCQRASTDSPAGLSYAKSIRHLSTNQVLSDRQVPAADGWLYQISAAHNAILGISASDGGGGE
uniref:Large ribosomal subunit protein bL20c n=1 Tax=Selaginella uncinata TaxID=307165 RepID=Q2WGG2_SELUN|nr:ribosomal protein L20 [Selaginella uncinata]